MHGGQNYFITLLDFVSVWLGNIRDCKAQSLSSSLSLFVSVSVPLYYTDVPVYVQFSRERILLSGIQLNGIQILRHIHFSRLESACIRCRLK